MPYAACGAAGRHRWQAARHRLSHGDPRRIAFDPPRDAIAVEAEVRYHLLAEARRKRIGYRNEAPISYPLFYERRTLRPGAPSATGVTISASVGAARSALPVSM